jgi:hypothetical protein
MIDAGPRRVRTNAVLDGNFPFIGPPASNPCALRYATACADRSRRDRETQKRSLAIQAVREFCEIRIAV